MIHAYVFDTMREATVFFHSDIDVYEGRILTASKHPLPHITLINGDEHWFMSDKAYETWKVGRTYMLYKEEYHSGYKTGREMK